MRWLTAALLLLTGCSLLSSTPPTFTTVAYCNHMPRIGPDPTNGAHDRYVVVEVARSYSNRESVDIVYVSTKWTNSLKIMGDAEQKCLMRGAFPEGLHGQTIEIDIGYTVNGGKAIHITATCIIKELQ